MSNYQNCFLRREYGNLKISNKLHKQYYNSIVNIVIKKVVMCNMKIIKILK